LWINLPAEKKMTAPEYQDVSPESIPEVNDEATSVRIIAGEFNGIRGPVTDPNTGFHFLDVTLSAHKDFVHHLAGNDTAFIYVFEGSASIGDTNVKEQQLAVLGEGEQVTVMADGNDARFLLVAGRAIGEPIVQYGPFVMNTREEIEQALADYRDGKLVQTRANMIERN
jgi:redox-sensitive bicupin YhaK (pirin superfamily)